MGSLWPLRSEDVVSRIACMLAADGAPGDAYRRQLDDIAVLIDPERSTIDIDSGQLECYLIGVQRCFRSLRKLAAAFGIPLKAPPGGDSADPHQAAGEAQEAPLPLPRASCGDGSLAGGRKRADCGDGSLAGGRKSARTRDCDSAQGGARAGGDAAPRRADGRRTRHAQQARGEAPAHAAVNGDAHLPRAPACSRGHSHTRDGRRVQPKAGVLHAAAGGGDGGHPEATAPRTLRRRGQAWGSAQDRARASGQDHQSLAVDQQDLISSEGCSPGAPAHQGAPSAPNPAHSAPRRRDGPPPACAPACPVASLPAPAATTGARLHHASSQTDLSLLSLPTSWLDALPLLPGIATPGPAAAAETLGQGLVSADVDAGAPDLDGDGEAPTSPVAGQIRPQPPNPDPSPGPASPVDGDGPPGSGAPRAAAQVGQLLLLADRLNSNSKPARTASARPERSGAPAGQGWPLPISPPVSGLKAGAQVEREPSDEEATEGCGPGATGCSSEVSACLGKAPTTATASGPISGPISDSVSVPAAASGPVSGPGSGPVSGLTQADCRQPAPTRGRHPSAARAPRGDVDSAGWSGVQRARRAPKRQATQQLADAITDLAGTAATCGDLSARLVSATLGAGAPPKLLVWFEVLDDEGQSTGELVSSSQLAQRSSLSGHKNSWMAVKVQGMSLDAWCNQVASQLPPQPSRLGPRRGQSSRIRNHAPPARGDVTAAPFRCAAAGASGSGDPDAGATAGEAGRPDGVPPCEAPMHKRQAGAQTLLFRSTGPDPERPGSPMATSLRTQPAPPEKLLPSEGHAQHAPLVRGGDRGHRAGHTSVDRLAQQHAQVSAELHHQLLRQQLWSHALHVAQLSASQPQSMGQRYQQPGATSPPYSVGQTFPGQAPGMVPCLGQALMCALGAGGGPAAAAVPRPNAGWAGQAQPGQGPLLSSLAPAAPRAATNGATAATAATRAGPAAAPASSQLPAAADQAGNRSEAAQGTARPTPGEGRAQGGAAPGLGLAWQAAWAGEQGGVGWHELPQGRLGSGQGRAPVRLQGLNSNQGLPGLNQGPGHPRDQAFPPLTHPYLSFPSAAAWLQGSFPPTPGTWLGQSAAAAPNGWPAHTAHATHGSAPSPTSAPAAPQHLPRPTAPQHASQPDPAPAPAPRSAPVDPKPQPPTPPHTGPGPGMPVAGKAPPAPSAPGPPAPAAPAPAAPASNPGQQNTSLCSEPAITAPAPAITPPAPAITAPAPAIATPAPAIATPTPVAPEALRRPPTAASTPMMIPVTRTRGKNPAVTALEQPRLVQAINDAAGLEARCGDMRAKLRGVAANDIVFDELDADTGQPTGALLSRVQLSNRSNVAHQNNSWKVTKVQGLALDAWVCQLWSQVSGDGLQCDGTD